MAYQIFVGLLAEGSTDHRFLSSIIERTLHEVDFLAKTEMEIREVRIIPKGQSNRFIDQVCEAAINGYEEYGLTLLCVHTDADQPDSSNSFANKINPAFKAVSELKVGHIEYLVPIVPVQMSEAWILADLALLLEEIGTNLSSSDLGLNQPPESYSDPKQVISKAIVQARSGLNRRRRRELNITDLYGILGQKIKLDGLRKLSSFQTFEEAVKKTFKAMNLID